MLLFSILVKAATRRTGMAGPCSRNAIAPCLYDYRQTTWGVTSNFNIKFELLIDLNLKLYAFLTGESLRRQARAGLSFLSCCISQSRSRKSTLCLFLQFWDGYLSSLKETTEPSLWLRGTASNSSSNMESATRTGTQGLAASSTTSTCGQCAGPLTIQRGT